jgi:GxxExxY protein
MEQREIVAKAVVQSFYVVYRALGVGFLEKVYENALALELRNTGFVVQQQAPIDVYYAGQIMGTYFADILVENCVIVEIKAVQEIVLEHEAQLLNYLKATDINLGLLVNFGPRPQVKRKIYETARQT